MDDTEKKSINKNESIRVAVDRLIEMSYLEIDESGRYAHLSTTGIELAKKLGIEVKSQAFPR